MATYDLWGWYSADDYPGRQAPDPVNMSMTTVPGELRANWTGQEWVDIPYSAPPEIHITAPVPEFISRLQAKAILMMRGHYDDVVTIINSEHPLTKLAWDEAQDFYRHAPLVVSISNQMGWTADYVDDMFRDGKTINLAERAFLF